MIVREFRVLKPKSVLLSLMDQAFGWPFDPIEFEKAIKVDPRLRDGRVGFCALDDGKVVSFVGVMDLATRTLDGSIERVGGVYGVATLPGHTRRGSCTVLMKHAHTYFVERGYRFSFLTTSPTIVAYELYRKLGYFDVTSFPGVYKVKEKIGPARALKAGRGSKLESDKMLRIYNEYVGGKTGFVVRDRAYYRMLSKIHEIASKECVLSQEGYVIFKKEKKLVRIRELVASREEELNRLIGIVEGDAKHQVYCRAIIDSSLRHIFKSRGYMTLEKGHGVLMVKPLVSDASFEEAYGTKFFMTALDHF